jgi:hypothetical protein
MKRPNLTLALAAFFASLAQRQPCKSRPLVVDCALELLPWGHSPTRLRPRRPTAQPISTHYLLRCRHASHKYLPALRAPFTS